MPNREDDDKLAHELLVSGWRQASILTDIGDTELRVRQGYDPATEYLVVCTQSCGLVSPNFTANPDVELMVATRVPKLRPKSSEAKGKNVREFHLPTSGIEGAQALRCNINRRCWIERRMLEGRRPTNVGVSRQDARRFAGWLSRYYGRASLPSLLVEIAFKETAPFSVMAEILSETVVDTSAPAGDGIEAIYISCVPDDELDGKPGHYDVKMRFLCIDPATQEHVDRALLERLEQYNAGAVVDRLKFSFVVELTSQTTVADLSGFERFSEWDHFTGLDEIRQLQTRELA